jgi:hypothetical protein
VEDQKLLEDVGWKNKLDEIDTAIQANARFLRRIVRNPEIFEGGEHVEDEGGDVESGGEVAGFQPDTREARKTTRTLICIECLDF